MDQKVTSLSPYGPLSPPTGECSMKAIRFKVQDTFPSPQTHPSLEGWHSRGYLPHFDINGIYQAITYRLADSLPGARASRPLLHQNEKEKIDHRKHIQQELDKGYGSCVLRNPNIATIVVNAWKHFDGKRYDLVAYVVMPNHVHVLIKTYVGFPLSGVIHSWKSFTGHKIESYLKNSGRDARAPGKGSKTWQNEYFDRFIRDERHFVQTIAYIHENPVKAGLCRKASEWPWSSAKNTSPA